MDLAAKKAGLQQTLKHTRETNSKIMSFGYNLTLKWTCFVQADDVLFSQALNNNHHVLHTHTLLPNKLEITYQLRHRRHNLTLQRKLGSTTQCDFITRQLLTVYMCILFWRRCFVLIVGFANFTLKIFLSYLILEHYPSAPSDCTLY